MAEVGVENVICPKDKIVFDATTGEFICTETGEVLEERVVDLGPEWRPYIKEERVERERVGSPITFRIHDNGLTTDVSDGGKLRVLHRKLRVNYKERKVVTYLSILNDEAAKLGLPGYVIEDAAIKLRKIVGDMKQRRVNKYAIVYAVIYYSARSYNIPISLQELRKKCAEVVNDMRELWRAMEIAKEYYKNTFISPSYYIPKVVEKLQLSQATATKAAEILNVLYNKGIISGKSHVGAAAAAIYLAAVVNDEKRLQREIAESIGVSDITLRSNLRLIVKHFPVVYKCKNCGAIVYKFERVGQDSVGIRTPYEVKCGYDWKCPSCGKPLDLVVEVGRDDGSPPLEGARLHNGRGE
jgi:transcription initiation factor TFIIB